MNHELGRRFLQLPRPGHPEKPHADGIAGLNLQIISQPLRDQDRSLRPLLRQPGGARFGSRGHGIGGGPARITIDPVDQIRQDSLRLWKRILGHRRRFRCQKDAASG